MNQLRKFMYGRYGFDQFTRALVIVFFILSILSTLTRIPVFLIVSYIPMIYAIFRIISRNIPNRTRENMQYCKLVGNVRGKLQPMKLRLVGTKTHMYYKCSHCKQTIRVPRGKGKICISCPKCKKEFIRRT